MTEIVNLISKVKYYIFKIRLLWAVFKEIMVTTYMSFKENI